MDGEVALFQYWFHQPELKLFCETNLKVQRVDQLMIYKSGQIVKISSIFMSKRAQMLKQFWAKNKFLVHLNPFKNFEESFEENLKNDLQLLTMYFEYKSKRKEELKRKFENPRVKTVLRDYIQTLIKCKPRSVMKFTLEFMRKMEHNGNVQMEILETVDRRQQAD
jgi:hypothetical protein